MLTNAHLLRRPKAFANGSSANEKLSKTQLYKISQSGEFRQQQHMQLFIKTMFASGTMALTISNEAMNDMKIIKSFEQSGLLTKGARETITNEAKEQTEGFLGLL